LCPTLSRLVEGSLCILDARSGTILGSNRTRQSDSDLIGLLLEFLSAPSQNLALLLKVSSHKPGVKLHLKTPFFLMQPSNLSQRGIPRHLGSFMNRPYFGQRLFGACRSRGQIAVALVGNTKGSLNAVRTIGRALQLPPGYLKSPYAVANLKLLFPCALHLL
jgi:hypothetical protein